MISNLKYKKHSKFGPSKTQSKHETGDSRQFAQRNLDFINLFVFKQIPKLIQKFIKKPRRNNTKSDKKRPASNLSSCKQLEFREFIECFNSLLTIRYPSRVLSRHGLCGRCFINGHRRPRTELLKLGVYYA